MPGYDEETGTVGKSKEVDAEAQAAAKAIHDPNFKTCTEDPNAGSGGDEPRGNKA